VSADSTTSAPRAQGTGGRDQAYFDELVTAATSTLTGDEVLLANISGERTDFIRLNNSDVRQAGTVDQRTLAVDLVEGRRHTGGSIRLSGDRSVDDTRLAALLAQLREQRSHVADDPFLLYNTEPTSTERVERGSIPEPDAALAEIRSAGKGRDLVGIYASGDTFQGFANSLGQRNWFQSSTFNLDWCFYLRADKAAKNLYAGFEWDDDVFATKVDWSARQLQALEREPISLTPGEYRTYLAPRAVEELMQLWSYYGAFGLRAHETKQTPLLKMLVDGATLSPLVNITEDTASGVAANFQSAGFLRPDQVPLIVDGAYAQTLVSPRSAQEYGVPTNGAVGHEYPQSLAIAPGTIPTESVGEALGSGLFVGNLWYTNFSDQAACRTTGMTRFATFWMEDGEIVAPVNVLRFDDTAYHLLGDQLEGLTDTAEVLLDTSTYEERSTDSARLPGALVGAMRFVL
jgi:predicted Zn-dependent protease